MINLTTYINEKLVIDKNVHVPQYKKGDKLCTTWIEDFEDEATGKVVQIFRVGLSGATFEKYEDSKLYLKYSDGEIREYEMLKNKHHFFEVIDSETSYTLFLPLENAKALIEDALKMTVKDFVNNVLFEQYYEIKKDININKLGLSYFNNDKILKKTLKEINAELKKVHK